MQDEKDAVEMVVVVVVACRMKEQLWWSRWLLCMQDGKAVVVVVVVVVVACRMKRRLWWLSDAG